MSLLARIARILIIAGVLSLYITYFRELFRVYLSSVLNFPVGFEFFAEWIGMFTSLAIAYGLASIVSKKIEGRCD